MTYLYVLSTTGALERYNSNTEPVSQLPVRLP